MNKDKQIISINISKELQEELLRLAKELDMSVSAICRQAVKKFIQEHTNNELFTD